MDDTQFKSRKEQNIFLIFRTSTPALEHRSSYLMSNMGSFPRGTCAPVRRSPIATCYGLGGLVIESRWGCYFPHTPRPSLGTTQPPMQCVRCLSRGYKAEACRWPPTPSTAEVKERVVLYIYFPTEPSWPALGWTPQGWSGWNVRISTYCHLAARLRMRNISLLSYILV